MILIVGAGISGLSIAWQLAKAGEGVTVFDRGMAGQETTWAAGGMLAPQVEAEPGEEALLPAVRETSAETAIVTESGFSRYTSSPA